MKTRLLSSGILLSTSRFFTLKPFSVVASKWQFHSHRLCPPGPSLTKFHKYCVGFNWSIGNPIAADMAIQLLPGIWQDLKGRGVTLGWARWPHNCWNCKVLQNIHHRHCHCHHHHFQWTPEADVDDGVVRLAPHGRPLVVREEVHLGSWGWW